MVKKKSSRAPLKKNAEIQKESEHESEKVDTLQKRLQDFDQQVEERLNKMKADKVAVLDAIRTLYFVDKQRTPAHINSMLWVDYVNQNATSKREKAVRKSVNTLIDTATGTLTKKSKKKKIDEKNVAMTPMEGVRRSTRTRNQSVLGVSQVNNTPYVPMSGKPKNSKLGMEMKTPSNQNIPPQNMFITPKFDFRKPLPPNTTRKAQPGEVLVSLRGSPINNPKLEDLLQNVEEELDEETKKTLLTITEKLSNLGKI